MKKAKEKVERVEMRDKKGRYTKGTGGGPGRKKGDPKDLVCGDGKKRSVGVLLDDLLKAYASMGGEKFIKKWALESKGNLKKFIEILFKFAPQPESPSLPGGITHEISERFMPKLRIERVITDKLPDEAEERASNAETEERINYLEAQLKVKDEELRRLRNLVDEEDAEEIEHELIHLLELPEHTKADEEKIAKLKEKRDELRREIEERKL